MLLATSYRINYKWKQIISKEETIKVNLDVKMKMEHAYTVSAFERFPIWFASVCVKTTELALE